MMSIGTLFAYTLVAICILKLRYSKGLLYQPDDSDDSTSNKPEPLTVHGLLCPPMQPTARTSKNVSVSAVFIIFLVISLSLFISGGIEALHAHQWWILLCVSVNLLMLFLIILIIWRQPQSQTKAAFMVPFVPFLPILSTFVNVYLMVQLGSDTWIRYAVWMAIGLIIYFCYGVQHSVQKERLQRSRHEITIHNIAANNEPMEHGYEFKT
uniref:Cationic amino acid transporter C-terminal domain-containing protein n=1 Tax=Periophthalmus magnuspinnatus TaxID=409849 RepID=A0A3B3ZU56_9GOBI